MQRRAWEEQEAARQRQAEGQKRGGETAGRCRPKADSFPVEAPECYRAPTADPPDASPRSKDRSGEVRTKLAMEAGTSANKIRQALAVQGLTAQQKVCPVEPLPPSIPRFAASICLGKGNKLTHVIHGQVMAVFIDEDSQGRAMEGLMGLQLHVGQPIKNEFRNILIKKL